MSITQLKECQEKITAEGRGLRAHPNVFSEKDYLRQIMLQNELIIAALIEIVHTLDAREPE